MRTYRAGTGPILELLFTSDGTSLVCVESRNDSRTTKVIHWLCRDTATELPRCLAHQFLDIRAAVPKWDDPGREPEIGDVFLSPDGHWVAAQHYLGDPILLHLWDTRKGTWKHIEPADGHCFCVDAALFSPDGKLLVFASGTDGGGTHWLERLKLGNGHRLPPIEFPGYTVQYLALSADQRRLAAATYGSVFLYDHQRGPVQARKPSLELEDETGPIAFQPEGKKLAILFGDELLFWDGSTAEPERMSLGTCPESLSFSPDGRFLLLGCDDQTVRLWDCAAGRESQRFNWEVGAVSSVAFAPDGMTCAVGGEQGQILVWDVDD